MKFAICFSGSIRDFDTCFPSIKRYVLDNLNADIFLHLWKMPDVSQLSCNNFKWRNDACSEEYVINCLKPIKYVIDSYNDDWEKLIIKESGIDVSKLSNEKSRNYGINACGMYYKIYQSFKLLEEYCQETGTKYDIIIRARLDFIWQDHLHVEDFANATDKDIFLIRDKYASNTGLVTNDKFFAGTYNVMKNMCYLFNHISTYQKKGHWVEGQTLNQCHIKQYDLHPKWIGHAYTYYKCMNRHSIKKNNKHIIINNEITYADLWYELAYFLLYRNYQVHFINESTSDDQNNQTKLDILKAFPNFEVHEDLPKLTEIICLIGRAGKPELIETSDCNKKMNQILINPHLAQSMQQVDTNSNSTIIQINNNIKTLELVDFVYSIILVKHFGHKFNFTDKYLVENIAIGEDVIFQYLDHGYYQSTILSYDSSNKKYKLVVGKNNIKTSRKYLKIVNLMKYILVNNPEIMPVNFLSNDSSIF